MAAKHRKNQLMELEETLESLLNSFSEETEPLPAEAPSKARSARSKKGK